MTKKIYLMLLASMIMVGCSIPHHKSTQEPVSLEVQRPVKIDVYFGTQKEKKGFSPITVSAQGDKIYILSRPIFNLDKVVTVGVDHIDNRYYVRFRLTDSFLKRIRQEVKKDASLGYVITSNGKIISLKGLLGEHSFLFEVRNQRVAEEIKRMILEDTSILAE